MAEGSMESFQSVFDRYFGEVYGYVAYRLASDQDAVQDVTQEVFLAAWQSWASYKGTGLVLSWLRGIARNKVADHFRVATARHDAAEAGDLANLSARDQSPPGEQSLLLAQVMRLLPLEDVELLDEKSREGLAVHQMAERRARTEKSIESALSRARDLLKSTFQRLRSREEMCDDDIRF